VGANTQQINFHVDVQGDHGTLIREIGARAAVLLKNVNSALPLSKPKFLAGRPKWLRRPRLRSRFPRHGLGFGLCQFPIPRYA
jgi:hypothetical protein